MKKDIHPAYIKDAHVACACGNTFTTGSTKKTIQVEVCSKCHPFFTGEHRFMDVKGRVDKFQKQQEVAKKYQAIKSAKKAKFTGKEEKKTKSLKELLGEV